MMNMNEYSNLLHSMKFPGTDVPGAFLTKSSSGDMGRNSLPANKNRLEIMNLLGIKDLVTLNQNHTRIVFTADEIAGLTNVTGDGLITAGRETLAVTVADCLPIFLFDGVKKVYGIVHSGWKGTGIAVNALRKMGKEYGSRASDISVIIGPSIGKCCYEVDRERAENFASEWGSDSVVHNGSHFFLDLQKANLTALTAEGIKTIEIADACTCCGSGFYSYRRDGAKEFSLMLALIGYFG